MLKRTIDDQPTDEGQTYKEDPNNPDVLIREIKKHTELFRTLTETDVNQIKRLDEKRRSAFIFCELVKKEHHADVYWHPNPITIKNVEAATQRINAYLRSKRIKMANHTTELQGIFDTLHYFQQWSTSPVIFDKEG